MWLLMWLETVLELNTAAWLAIVLHGQYFLKTIVGMMLKKGLSVWLCLGFDKSWSILVLRTVWNGWHSSHRLNINAGQGAISVLLDQSNISKPQANSLALISNAVSCELFLWDICKWWFDSAGGCVSWCTHDPPGGMQMWWQLTNIMERLFSV